MKELPARPTPLAEHAKVLFAMSQVDDKGRGVPAGAEGTIIHIYPASTAPEPVYIVEVPILDRDGMQVDMHLCDVDHAELRPPGTPLPTLNVPEEVRAKMEGLLGRRAVAILTAIDDLIVHDVSVRIRLLVARQPRGPIRVVVNSPGGYVTSSIVLHDLLRSLHMPVDTVCIGQAQGMAALIMAAGTRGRRTCLPTAMFSLCAIESSRRDARTRESVDRLHDRVAVLLSTLTGRPTDRVRADMMLDVALNAEQARAYGLIDTITEDIFPRST